MTQHKIEEVFPLDLDWIVSGIYPDGVTVIPAEEIAPRLLVATRYAVIDSIADWLAAPEQREMPAGACALKLRQILEGR